MRPDEHVSQRQAVLMMRAAIDTAIAHPHQPNIDVALSLAAKLPKAMRSGLMRRELGKGRWSWLESQGYYPVGEATEIADQPAFKGTASPDVRK